MAKIKLEGSDIAEMMSLPTKEEAADYAARYERALKAVQDKIIAHASTLKITYEEEDGEIPATAQDLMQAVQLARLESLERFLGARRVKRLPFEGGYLTVRY